MHHTSPPASCLLHLASCLLLLVSCLLPLTSCTPQPLGVTREPVTLRLSAARSCESLAETLSTAYEETHPWVTIDVQVYGTALAEQMLREDGADVALLSWLEPGGDTTLWSRPFAQDGIAVIVHPTTPFTETNMALLQEIYRGRVQEWEGVVLAVTSREDSSGTRAAFDAIILQGRDITLTAVAMISDEAVIEYVARTPGSIGYVSTLQLQDPAASGVRMLPVENVSPTSSTIANGSYPLSRSLYLATAGEPAGEAREFAQWVLGPEGQRAIRALLN